MAKRCAICGKGISTGNKVSHSKRHTKRLWKPNLQRVKVYIGGEKKRIYVCAKCLRSGKVKRAI